jgi:hypothetical protein
MICDHWVDASRLPRLYTSITDYLSHKAGLNAGGAYVLLTTVLGIHPPVPKQGENLFPEVELHYTRDLSFNQTWTR